MVFAISSMKTGFTKTQSEIIFTVEKYLAEGDSFADAVMYTSNDLKFKDWYIKETYISYKTMVIVTQ